MDNKDLVIIKGLIAQFIAELHKEEKRILSELDTITDHREAAQKVIALQRIYNTLETAEKMAGQ